MVKRRQTKQIATPQSKNASPMGGTDMTRGEAAGYIADLLDELKTIANCAGLSFVAYLLAMAKEEAKTEKSRNE